MPFYQSISYLLFKNFFKHVFFNICHFDIVISVSLCLQIPFLIKSKISQFLMIFSEPCIFLRPTEQRHLYLFTKRPTTPLHTLRSAAKCSLSIPTFPNPVPLSPNEYQSRRYFDQCPQLLYFDQSWDQNS